ncbi:MAG TPA: cupredoxin domain-containing protein [Methanoculleus sp.]|uniref:cupredoxin domain-containing protein n=1 Tax=Methanoculleus sp. TaxID=90427 RepID=UPI001B415489|nr:cupredoxin domain-containing protein [Methanoculleus sp.]MBP7145444.1 cupredoxin domain-containing protein [Methanoculleus sp.]HNV38098.1 cupredoxin domain-containing protein [Methanoculleus sp.]HOC84389.1 cupredoxin domain-containing protein [Methanoculleus sp.]HOI62221.1 cupredoxin domain-containing protein [Methanoculleus sp.]HOS68100.1 cupredoxin domain-containing protein [Methanoculleus sp.]
MTPETATAEVAKSVTIDIVSVNMAFDLDTITVPAGAEVTINLDNQDVGIPHNVSFYTDSSAAETIFVGDLITGPDKVTQTFTAPAEPGSYYFQCDVHPFMNGTFVVE